MFRCKFKHKMNGAVGLFYLPEACPCFDNHFQFLCYQHLIKLINSGYPVITLLKWG